MTTPRTTAARAALPPGPSRGRPARRAYLALAALALALAGGLLAFRRAGPPAPEAAGEASRRGAARASSAAESTRGGAPARAARAPAAPDRVVAATYAPALFAPHSWYVPKPKPPEPPPPPPPPPPAPTAPPLPYTFLGSVVRHGEAPVYFLSRGDRVIDAHVGDRLDGVYQLVSAAGGQLVFVYLPLDVRQTLAAGVSK